MDRADDPILAEKSIGTTSAAVPLLDNIPDPDPDWAERNPDRALAFLYVSPRPCEALDRLLRM